MILKQIIMNKNVGIGFRKDFAEEFLSADLLHPAFVELAPENWMGIGGYWTGAYRRFRRYIDWTFLKHVKEFIREYDIQIYSEHLSFSKCDNAHLYDLLPIPFRDDSIRHVADRIKQVQNFLEMKIAIENVSYYTPVAAEMSELEFINTIIDRKRVV